MPCGQYKIWLREEIKSFTYIDENTSEVFRQDGKPLAGFIKAILIPPKSGHNAKLPFFTTDIGDKFKPFMVGALCRACALKRSKLPCNHADKARQIIVTTMISSLNYA